MTYFCVVLHVLPFVFKESNKKLPVTMLIDSFISKYFISELDGKIRSP